MFKLFILPTNMYLLDNYEYIMYEIV